MGSSLLGLVLGFGQGPLAATGGPTTFFIGTIILFSLAAYEALTVRRALAVSLYRNQALGVGLVAFSFVLSLLSAIITATYFCPSSCQSSGGSFGEPISLPFLYFFVLVLLYWVDSSMRAARRSDPLLRNSLHWSRVRIVAWVLTVGFIVLNSAYVLYLVIATGLPFDAVPNLPPLFSIIELVPLYVPVALGATFLPLGTRRSGDRTLRRHLVWFGLFVLLLLATLISFIGLSISVPSDLEALRHAIVNYSAFVALNVAGYFLYRSGRFLVPLHRISIAD